MSYEELNENEKNELRTRLYFAAFSPGEDIDYDNLSDEEKETVINANCPEDIPEKTMVSAYGDYSFVEEDFFCNIK